LSISNNKFSNDGLYVTIIAHIEFLLILIYYPRTITITTF